MNVLKLKFEQCIKNPLILSARHNSYYDGCIEGCMLRYDFEAKSLSMDGPLLGMFRFQIKIFFLSFYFMTLSAVDLNPLTMAKRHKAVKAYQEKDYDTAQRMFEKLVLEDHTDYEAFYNLGKVAYAKKEFEKAEGHFSTLTQVDSLASGQKLQAWFDLGNTQVQERKLNDALSSYQEVLKIDQQHEHAKKMIEIITKLLQEQEQQKDPKQQQQDQQQEKKDSQEQQDNQKQQDQQKQQQDQQEQEQQDQQQDKQENQEEQKSQQEQDQQQKDQEQQEQQDNQKQQDQQQENQEQKSQQAQEQKDQDQQQQGSEQQQMQAVAQQQNDEKKIDDKLDEQEVLLLKLLEEKEATALKQLLKGTIKKEMQGHHGQKNW